MRYYLIIRHSGVCFKSPKWSNLYDWIDLAQGSMDMIISAKRFIQNFKQTRVFSSGRGTLSLFDIFLAVMIILFVVISLRTPPTPWGDVSQALIYHQVSSSCRHLFSSLKLERKAKEVVENVVLNRWITLSK